MTLTDEEMSEFAECLDDACREWVARGGSIVPYEPDKDQPRECNCPLGALAPERHRFPTPSGARINSGVDLLIARGVIIGFQAGEPGPGTSDLYDPRAREIGRGLREKYYGGAP